jgi:hypothetical protein
MRMVMIVEVSVVEVIVVGVVGIVVVSVAMLPLGYAVRNCPAIHQVTFCSEVGIASDMVHHVRTSMSCALGATVSGDAIVLSRGQARFALVHTVRLHGHHGTTGKRPPWTRQDHGAIGISRDVVLRDRSMFLALSAAVLVDVIVLSRGKARVALQHAPRLHGHHGHARVFHGPLKLHL